MIRSFIQVIVAAAVSCVALNALAQDSTDASFNQFQQWLKGDINARDKVALEGAPASRGGGSASTAAAPPTPFTASNPGPSAAAPPVPPPSTATRANIPPPPPPTYTYEEGQQAMIDTLPQGLFPPTPESTAAFNSMLQQKMPLSPQQVVRLRQQIDLTQRAAAVPPTIPPKPVSSTVMINLAPGTTPPAVRLAQGYVTSLVFVDSTGAPWPIAAFDIGNPKAVNMQWDGKSNILFIQALSRYSNGDIVIRLVGLPTPVTLELVAGQRVVDFRADIHVPGIGPNAKELPMGMNLPDGANQLLLGVLDGVAPAGSRPLNVKGADCQAWLLGDKMYLRTRLTVLSPGWTGSMTSPDGMQAYELPKTSSVLVSRYGEPTELKVEGY